MTPGNMQYNEQQQPVTYIYKTENNYLTSKISTTQKVLWVGQILQALYSKLTRTAANTSNSF